ncbi:MAG: tetratricopeptide repeat protein [Muribaculaceae bacterium]|nr:tetratricopeptide repeat protein [Muribaculaceae bacterium]
MKTKLFILSLVAAFAVTAVAQNSDVVVRDKLTSAVMKVYDDHLAQNPNDYNTLFARAHQHYYNGNYTAALADVNQALLLTPKTDKELRFDEYILRARISDARTDYASELADLRMAQEIQPKSLPCTDMIAKANLKSGNLDAAEKAFKTILRAEPMNYDAMYGMAKVELQRGNSKAAIDYVNQAAELFRAEPQVYVNRADIYARQGNMDAAVTNLLDGMTVGDGGNAAQALFDLSDTNYDGVMNALALKADQTSNSIESGICRFLRANIAMDHTCYAQALRDLQTIKRGHLYNSPTVDYNMGKCSLELGRFDEAITHLDNAIAIEGTHPEYFVTKAIAQYYAGDGGNFDDAMETLKQCSAMAPQFVPMLLAKASLLSAQGKDQEALGYLNSAVANEPDNAEALMARGLLFKKMDNLKLAVNDYNIVSRLSDDVYDLKGFGLSELGRDNDAFKWLHKITSATIAGGEGFYYAALLMAQRGDSFKAMEYLQKALENGYGSLFNLKYNDLSPLNFKSLSNESGFPLLLEKAQRNFVEHY